MPWVTLVGTSVLKVLPAHKGDHRVQVLWVNAKGGFQGFEVLVVLPQRFWNLKVRL